MRKKKCGEERPICSTCDLLRIPCHGYNEKPSWMDGAHRERRALDNIKQTVKQTNKHRRRAQAPRNRSTQSTVTPDTAALEKARGVATARNSTPLSRSIVFHSPEFADSDGSDKIVDAVERTGSAMIGSSCSQLNQLESSGYVSQSGETLCLRCGLSRTSDKYNGREASLLMHYLDCVFPLLFRFYRPSISEGGRGWLLSILLRTKPLFHAALSLSAYHQRSILPENVGNEKDCNIMEDLEMHHSMTLIELRRHIDRIQLEVGARCMVTRVEVLACMILLISFEVSPCLHTFTRKLSF